MCQKPFTVAHTQEGLFAIVWTRDKALARSWAATRWGLDPVLIDVWPTTQEDQQYGLKAYYA